jgi:hypothetical protein
VIWEPFVLALVLGLIISAGLYFAYLWPSIEPLPLEDGDPVAPPEMPRDRVTGQTADPAPGSASPRS